MEEIFTADRPWGQKYRKRLPSDVFLVSSYQRSQALTGSDWGVLAHNSWMHLGQMQQSSENLYLFLPNFCLQIKFALKYECCGLGNLLYTADYLKETTLTHFKRKVFFSKGRNYIAIHWRFTIQQTVQFRVSASPLVCNTDCETLSFWYHLLYTVSLYKALDLIEFGSGITI